MAGRRAYYAWGFGGQFIVLVPSLDLVVVSTSAALRAPTNTEDRMKIAADAIAMSGPAPHARLRAHGLRVPRPRPAT